jgi:hypothetical protein
LFLNLQDKSITEVGDRKVQKEKLPSELRGRKQRFRLTLGSKEKYDKEEDEEEEEGPLIPDIIDVDYFIEDPTDTRVRAKLDLQIKYFRRFKPTMGEIFVKFLRMFAKKIS